MRSSIFTAVFVVPYFGEVEMSETMRHTYRDEWETADHIAKQLVERLRNYLAHRRWQGADPIWNIPRLSGIEVLGKGIRTYSPPYRPDGWEDAPTNPDAPDYDR